MSFKVFFFEYIAYDTYLRRVRLLQPLWRSGIPCCNSTPTYWGSEAFSHVNVECTGVSCTNLDQLLLRSEDLIETLALETASWPKSKDDRLAPR